MKNPQLMLMRRGNRKYRVVAVGDTYQGPKRGFSLLPGQPREGLNYGDACALAAKWGPEKILNLVRDRVGSYVSPNVLRKLEPLGEELSGGFRPERPSISPTRTESASEVVNRESAPAPVAPIARMNSSLNPAAELILRRRAALKMLAEIDSKLEQLIEPRAVEVIQQGMALPLSALN